jgi:hypothetical protein
MRKFALAAAVAVGLFGIVGTADAQFRVRGVTVQPVYTSYSYPTYTYSYPTYRYTYPAYTYAYPTYSSEVVTTSSYTPATTSNVVVTTPTYYTPAYTPVYTTPVYSSYDSGVYIAPRGGSWRGRGWRW